MEETNKVLEKNTKKIFRVILENENIFYDVDVYKHFPKSKNVNEYRNVIKMLQKDKPKIIGALTDSKKYEEYTKVRISKTKDPKNYVHNLIIEILIDLMKNGTINPKEFTFFAQELGNIKKQYNKQEYAQTLAKVFQMEEKGDVESMKIPFLPFEMEWGEFYLIVGKAGGSKTDLMVRISQFLIDNKHKLEYFNLEIKDTKFFNRLALTYGFGKYKEYTDKFGEKRSGYFTTAAEKTQISNRFLDYGNLYDANFSHIKQIEEIIINTDAKFILIDYLDFVKLGGNNDGLDGWKKADIGVRKLIDLAKIHGKIIFCIGVLNQRDGVPNQFSVMGGHCTRHDPDGILCLEPHEDGILMRTLKNRNGSPDEVTIHEFHRGTKTWGRMRKE